MPLLNVRLRDDELASVKSEAASQGKTVSALVRERLGLVESHDDERFGDLDRRVSRLEELAGL